MTEWTRTFSEWKYADRSYLARVRPAMIREQVIPNKHEAARQQVAFQLLRFLEEIGDKWVKVKHESYQQELSDGVKVSYRVTVTVKED